MSHLLARYAAQGPFMQQQPTVVAVSGRLSCIHKALATNRVWLDYDGLRGDSVVDRRHHGGPDRALCHYPAQHYEKWRAQYKTLDIPMIPGAFGENIATENLSESEVCVGDQFRWGEAEIEVSQPRSPCTTLDAWHDLPKLADSLAKTGCTGWLYRTLKPGWIYPNAPLECIAISHARISVLRVWQARAANDAPDEELQLMAEFPALAPHYRDRFAQRLAYRQQAQHD